MEATRRIFDEDAYIIEFEAKVLRDLINTLKANLDYAYPLYIPTIGQNTTFTTE